MKKIIKAGSITNLTDARFFASYGVEFIGFCFDPQSSAYLSPHEALAIKGWLHNVKIVAEFANQDAENIKSIIDYLQPDVLEFKFSELTSHGIKKIIEEHHHPLIISCQVDELKKIPPGKYLFVLLENYQDENISNLPFPVMIDLSENKLNHLNQQIFSIQIKGSPETEVGVKDFDTIVNFLETYLT